MLIRQVRPLLPGYEHECGYVHGLHRRSDRQDSDAGTHAILPDLPLQPEVLRQRRRRVRRRVAEAFRHAGNLDRSIFRDNRALSG